MSLTAPTVRVPRRKQSAAEDQRVYRYVTARDVSCRAPAIELMRFSLAGVGMRFECSGPLERHHAGNTIGSKRITDARHCVLLCRWHHATWAPTHSRLILEYLARIEDAREKAAS